MQDVLIVMSATVTPIRKADLAAVGFGLSAAGRTGGACDILLLGPAAEAQASSLACFGARTVYTLEHSDLHIYTPEAYTRAAATFLANRRYRLICAATSSSTREFFPRLAARLGIAMVSDILKLEEINGESASFTRAVFVGNLLATVQASGETLLVTCRGAAFEAPATTSSTSALQSVTIAEPLAHPRKRFIAAHQPKSDRPELTEAEIVVSAGRGTRGPDQGIPLVMNLADQLGAAVGATRAVVDAGWLANEHQVGQTGKIVAPRLYIGIGLSGSIQHLAGMRNSRTIVAINKDPEAPIFEVADVGLVADLFEALPALTQAIDAIREGS